MLHASENRKRKAQNDLDKTMTTLNDALTNQKAQQVNHTFEIMSITSFYNNQISQFQLEKNKKIQQSIDCNKIITQNNNVRINELTSKWQTANKIYKKETKKSNPFFQIVEEFLFDCESLILIVLSYSNMKWCNVCEILVPKMVGCLGCFNKTEQKEWIISDFAFKSENLYVFQNCNDQQVMDEFNDLTDNKISIQDELLDSGTILTISLETDSEQEENNDENEGDNDINNDDDDNDSNDDNDNDSENDRNDGNDNDSDNDSNNSGNDNNNDNNKHKNKDVPKKMTMYLRVKK